MRPLRRVALASAALAMAAGIRTLQRNAINKMLDLNRDGASDDSKNWNDPWKILVYDAFGRDIISPLLLVADATPTAPQAPASLAAPSAHPQPAPLSVLLPQPPPLAPVVFGDRLVSPPPAAQRAAVLPGAACGRGANQEA
mgnify:CR=1 FL=1